MSTKQKLMSERYWGFSLTQCRQQICTYLNVILTLCLLVWQMLAYQHLFSTRMFAGLPQRIDPQMICAGINTAVENCGFDLSVCHSVELPGALWCLGLWGCGVLGWWAGLGLCSRPRSFGSLDFFGALGGWVTTLQCAAQKWLECDFSCWLYFYFFWM